MPTHLFRRGAMAVAVAALVGTATGTATAEPVATPAATTTAAEDARTLPYHGTINIGCCLDSARFVTSKPRVCMTTRFRRESANTPSEMTIELYRVEDAHVRAGQRTVSTVADDRACWPVTGEEEHYFRFVKANDRVPVRGSFSAK